MEHSSISNVEGFFSGNLHDNEIDALYQGAKFVIIPSFYEGFGFPVVRGLAYGKTVIVRQSELWHEIARNVPGVGRLIEFTKTLDLVEILALLLRGEVLPCLRLGASVSAKTEPHNWQRVGEQIIEFAKRLRESEKPERWLQRDRALRYIYESSGR
jgi:glycosyltransferase involved in cell wall biosynthesis